MNPRTLLLRAVLSGSLASVVSTIALLLGGKADAGKAAAPVNAISHWLWGDRAFRRREVNCRNTLLGYAIHHAMSVFWALAFEASRSWTPQRPATRALGTATLACLVDYTITPRRFTPGFEKRLSIPSIAFVYLAFGAGLVIGEAVLRRGGRAAAPYRRAM